MRAAVIRAQETSSVLWGLRGQRFRKHFKCTHGWVGGRGQRTGMAQRPEVAQPTPEQPGLSVLEKAELVLGPHSPLVPLPPSPGDFAYNMDQDNARVGDEFMRLIEPVAASLPYMTCPGNHEER